MRLRTIAIWALAIAFGGSLFAQENSSGKKVFGYQDSEGTFHPMAKAVPDTTTPATTGTVDVTLTITVKSTFPTGTTRSILCGANVIATMISATDTVTDYTETAYANATGSGTSFTCTLKIPYSWIVSSTAVEKSVLGSYIVTVNNSTLSAGPAILRISQGDFLSTSTIPATGTTSSYAVAVTI